MNAPPPESREVEVSYYKALALATGGILTPVLGIFTQPHPQVVSTMGL